MRTTEQNRLAKREEDTGSEDRQDHSIRLRPASPQLLLGTGDTTAFALIALDGRPPGLTEC